MNTHDDTREQTAEADRLVCLTSMLGSVCDEVARLRAEVIAARADVAAIGAAMAAMGLRCEAIDRWLRYAYWAGRHEDTLHRMHATPSTDDTDSTTEPGKGGVADGHRRQAEPRRAGAVRPRPVGWPPRSRGLPAEIHGGGA